MNGAGSIRVLVVDDSLTVRRHIVEVIGAAEGFEVVGEAGDGRAAIELCERLRPSVVTMDMMLPVMTGVAATEYIMAHFPTPILIVSSSMNRGEAFRTYDALAAGAVEVMSKPTGLEDSEDEWGQRLLGMLRVVSRIPVITHVRGRLGRSGEGAPSHRPESRAPVPIPVAAQEERSSPSTTWTAPKGAIRVVAIGASTGGPGALAQIFRSLPGTFAPPILLVIHVGEPFGRTMVQWLDAQGPLGVRFAEDGEWLPPVGQPGVLMAPPGKHLALRRGRLRLTDDAERHSCRPSADVLFESVAEECASTAAGVLLTGIGRDGALGLGAIRNGGGLTIAQDEATSVVWGMPGEAVRLNAATCVLPVQDIAPFLERQVRRAGGVDDATGHGGRRG